MNRRELLKFIGGLPFLGFLKKEKCSTCGCGKDENEYCSNPFHFPQTCGTSSSTDMYFIEATKKAQKILIKQFSKNEA